MTGTMSLSYFHIAYAIIFAPFGKCFTKTGETVWNFHWKKKKNNQKYKIRFNWIIMYIIAYCLPDWFRLENKFRTTNRMRNGMKAWMVIVLDIIIQIIWNWNPISSLEIQLKSFWLLELSKMILQNTKLTKWIDNEQCSHDFKCPAGIKWLFISIFDIENVWTTNAEKYDENYEEARYANCRAIIHRTLWYICKYQASST